MSKTPSMTTLAKRYLDYRRRLGYQLTMEGPMLLQFARYADRPGHRGPLTNDLAIRSARQSRTATRLRWARRLEVVRCFARYLAIFDRRTEIPDGGVFGKAHRRIRPYIYSAQEVAALLSGARQLRPLAGLRPKTYATLFGLLACTGLRISEAIRLTRNDVDLQRGVLTIRLTKFRKSRLVPLHVSTKRVLSQYADSRDARHPKPASLAFFLSDRGRPLRYATVRNTFRKLRQQVGLVQKPGERAPRIHDLRHTFACQRLLEWNRKGVDIEHSMAALSVYLGHAKVTDTYWYLTGVPELFQIAVARFKHFAASSEGGQP